MLMKPQHNCKDQGKADNHLSMKFSKRYEFNLSYLSRKIGAMTLPEMPDNLKDAKMIANNRFAVDSQDCFRA